MDYYVKQVLAMAEDGASVQYIAHVVSEPVERVQDVLDGKLYRLDSTFQQPPKHRRPVPITRPFPELTDDMTDGERVIALTEHGLSAEKIRKYLKRPIGARAISQYATKKLGRPRCGRTSAEATWIVSWMVPLIHQLLAELGKDRYRCELCLDPVPKGCTIHHTRYEDSTLYDLMYLCQSCNLARENKGLT